nr:MAG TPA: Membrane fusion protein p14 fusion protein transmembrane domain [Caudoviricetes sp.]
MNKPEKMPIGLTSLSFYFWISKYLTERGEKCIL